MRKVVGILHYSDNTFLPPEGTPQFPKEQKNFVFNAKYMYYSRNF